MIDQGAYLFSFAVIADTHLNQNDLDSNSPFEVNRRANNRLRHVIEDLNRRDLALIIHLGDVVHPVPSMGDLYVESSKRFFEQFKQLKHPFHLIPGNHDVGDKPIEWGPATTVRDEFLQAWSTNFGAHYFHQVYRGIHFIGINAQLPGSALAMEFEQKQWLEALLENIRGQRIFLCSHYPPYLLHPNESEHYDNFAPVSRQWLLSLLREYRVEALFCGHVHQYWFNRFAQTQCYLLPSTAFTRQDYSEMFRIQSGVEHGRNDNKKLGYLLVHMYEHGHGVEIVRTSGRESLTRNPSRKNTQKNVQTNRTTLQKSPAFANFHGAFGFDLRHDWLEVTQIPPSGGLDEFDRKSVRNDYPLLALLDMGIRRLRLPLVDFIDPFRRQRLIELQSLGFCYRFCSFGVPDAATRELIGKHRELVGAWEICYPIRHVANLDETFFTLAQQCEIEVIFSPLRSKRDIVDAGKIYYHVINHGFTLDDAALLKTWFESKYATRFGKYLLRVSFNENIGDAMAFARVQSQQGAPKAAFQLRLSANDPAHNIDDDAWLCRRLAEAVVYAHCGCVIHCDTFADNDRGYFPHAGVVDRLYNPRTGMMLVQHLHILLADLPEGTVFACEKMEDVAENFPDDFDVFDLSSNENTRLLCVPREPLQKNCGVGMLRRCLQGARWDVLDLVSGEITNSKSANQSVIDTAIDGGFPFVLLR